MLAVVLLGIGSHAAASALNPTPAEIQDGKQVLKDTAAWLLEEHIDPANPSAPALPNGARRSVQLNESAPGAAQDLSDYERLNNHAACRSLEFLALYARYGADFTVLLNDGHTERHHVRLGVRRYVGLILSLRSNAPSMFDYGAIAAVPDSPETANYDTLPNAVCGRALLLASDTMNEPEWETRAIEIAQFLLRLQNPDPHYVGRVDLSGRSTRDGIFDGVYRKTIDGTQQNVLRANMRAWNLAAAPFLEEVYARTGVIGYHYGAIKIVRGLKEGALSQYDYYAIGGLPDSPYVNKVFYSPDCHAPTPYSDGQWHRAGDPCPRGVDGMYATTGTDGTEYGLAALHEYGYDPVALTQAYAELIDMPALDKQGLPQTDYDVSLSLLGYFRMCRVASPACAPYHYGSTYDTVGLGLLARFKLDLAPTANADDVFFQLLRGPLQLGTGAVPGPPSDPRMIAQWKKVTSAQVDDYPRWMTQGTLPVATNATAILKFIARCKIDPADTGCPN
ncbi:hypothetical protein [Lysobacter sp. cf310]|uniref:hypothetical protein n=1 Tax=Lysobacter sp. cf310 TaxID=1761790 RepID=UPI001113E2F6|nr:hypothetical protein [Lysobacter sp. cf310]